VRDVELQAGDGRFVAIVEIAPFPDAGLPRVVAWGARVFVRPERPSLAERMPIYVEAFAVVSFTPSPGKPRPAAPPPVDRSARDVVGAAVAPGEPDRTAGADGQQRGYVVLSDEERAKGFVRPVRRSYVHVGMPGPRYPLRDLTDEEREQHPGEIKYEAYPPEAAPRLGRFWSQHDLDTVGKGCGSVTTMGTKLAETYARDPGFYNATFCANCGTHPSVGDDGEFVWDGTTERVGT